MALQNEPETNVREPEVRRVATTKTKGVLSLRYAPKMPSFDIGVTTEGDGWVRTPVFQYDVHTS